jgi:hypothetical protein
VIRLIVFLLLIFSSLTFSFGQDPNRSTTILFVGNSLTYTNDLPDLVAQLGTASGQTIHVEVLAFPNYSLEDHWNEGNLQKLIKDSSFDFVIVQQGPSSLAEGKGMLLEYGEKIKNLCKRKNSKLAFFMVWPAKENYQHFDGVIQNYTEAATKTQSVLCPVGKIWKEHFDRTNDFEYYGPDGFHPSMIGSKVAAEVIYKTLFP